MLNKRAVLKNNEVTYCLSIKFGCIANITTGILLAKVRQKFAFIFYPQDINCFTGSTDCNKRPATDTSTVPSNL